MTKTIFLKEIICLQQRCSLALDYYTLGTGDNILITTMHVTSFRAFKISSRTMFFETNLQSSGNPKGTATAISDGKGRTGKVDHNKVKLHLTGELLFDATAVDSFDREINTNNNAKLQYFLFFNMFEDEQEHCAVMQRLTSKKGILRRGLTAKEAEIVIYVAKEVDEKDNIANIMPYFDKSSLISLLLEVSTMLEEQEHEDRYRTDEEYFINYVEATYERLSNNN